MSNLNGKNCLFQKQRLFCSVIHGGFGTDDGTPPPGFLASAKYRVAITVVVILPGKKK